MRFEMDTPDLVDTPELFSKVEANLMHEASRIKARHVARQRRSHWYEGLRPVLTVGAAFAAMVVFFPLTQTGVSATTTVPTERSSIQQATVEAAPASVAISHTDRLPTEDQAEIGREYSLLGRVS